MVRVNLKHQGTFKDGKFIPQDPEKLKKDILSIDGKEGFLVCMPYRKIKTNEQNKYYRGVVI